MCDNFLYNRFQRSLYNMPGLIQFEDHPEFRPNLTPYEIFKLGSFGGTYWRPIKSKFYVNKLKDQHHEFSWARRLSDDVLTRACEDYDININKYKVKVGGRDCGLEEWEQKSWIQKQDPYGWVQWYARFYNGRRTADDERQIKRWRGVAGSRGRFLLQYKNLKEDGVSNKEHRMRVLLQILQHWAKKP